MHGFPRFETTNVRGPKSNAISKLAEVRFGSGRHGEVDLAFDVIGGDIAKRSASLIRTGGTLVTVTGPADARPAGGLTIDFVVEPDRHQLSELVQRLRDGRVRTNIGNVAALDDAAATFNRSERIKGKTIIRVRP